MKRIVIFLFLSIVFSNCFAGWEIITRYYNSFDDPQNARLEHVYISDGFMKIVSSEMTTIFDLKKQEITYLNLTNKRYWKGNPEKFNSDVRNELRLKIDQELINTDKSNRVSQKEMYEEMIRNTFDDALSSQIAKNYVVKKLNQEQTIAGYKSLGYQVYDDAMPLEIIWIANDVNVSSELDFRSFSNLLFKLVKGAYGSSFENSSQYFTLVDQGYPLKVEMHLKSGNKSVSEAIKVNKINLNLSDFAIPVDFVQGTLTEVGVWEAYK
jgi:hypothetical protein